MGFGVQVVPTTLIATASINCGFWFVALSFSYDATLQIVCKFEELPQRSRSEGNSEELKITRP